MLLPGLFASYDQGYTTFVIYQSWLIVCTAGCQCDVGSSTMFLVFKCLIREALDYLSSMI
jgi:hypothetical protein